MTLYLEDFDLAKLVREVAATVQPLITKNGNSWKWIAAGPRHDARGRDESAAGFVHLLSNASSLRSAG